MYEYRETYYKVGVNGHEREKSERTTTSYFLIAMENYENAVADFIHNQGHKTWDLLTVEVARISEAGTREVLATAKLYADDIQA